jgi:hydrogenase maturation factor
MAEKRAGRHWRAGKLPAAQLHDLLAGLPQQDPRVILGPKIGEDAAVLDLGHSYLVAASDPVTFAADRIGWYVVHVNANDVAVLGAEPRWFLAVLLLPEGSEANELARVIMDDIGRTCQELGVTVCGGHTEITPGLQRPIVIGHMLGEVPSAGLIRKDAVLPGDQVIVTHGAAIEGTALLARDKRSELQGHLSTATLRRAEALLFRPGISVVPAAQVAVSGGIVHAMHDPTEGGISTGLVELATASGLGLEVFADRIPVLEETRAVCDCLRLDPLGLIASGALLLVTPPSATESVVMALHAEQIPAAVVAEVRPEGFGVKVREERQLRPLVPPGRDELARLFDRDS